jgi:hypothetical protein
VANYNEDAYFRAQQAAGFNPDGSGSAFADRRMKVPKHMRLPKMEDWQFYDAPKLHELFATEEALYAARKAAKDLPTHGINKLQVLDDDAQALKDRLLAEGRGDWGRAHYAAFVKSSAKHGRWDYARIALDVGKDPAEVASYAQLFWRVAAAKLPAAEYESVLRRVEKGERKLGDIERLSSATRRFLARWPRPLEQLCFRCVGTHGHVFGPDEDRRLLVYADKWGFGNWARIRAEVRACDLFRFDFYLRSLSAAELGKRCETLMREAAKELVELEKRSGAQDDLKAKLRAEAREALPVLCLDDVGSGDVIAEAAAGSVAGGAAADNAGMEEDGNGGASAASAASANGSSSSSSSSSSSGGGPQSARAAAEAAAAAVAEARARLYVVFAARQDVERQERDAQEAAAAVQRAAAAAAQPASEDDAASGSAAEKSSGIGGFGRGASPPKPVASSAQRPSIEGSGAGGGGEDEDAAGRDNGRFLLRPVTNEQLPALLHVVFAQKLDSRERIVAEFLKVHPQVSKRQVEAKLAEVAAKERRGADRAWWLKPAFLALYLAQKPPAPTHAASAAAAAGHPPATKLPKPKPPRAHGAVSPAAYAAPGPAAAAVAAGAASAEPPHPAYSAKALFRKHHLPGVKAKLGPSANKVAYKGELDRMWDAAPAAERAQFDAAAVADEARYQHELAAAAAAAAAAGSHGGAAAATRPCRSRPCRPARRRLALRRSEGRRRRSGRPRR